MRLISIGIRWLTREKLRFLTVLGYFGRFLAISSLVLQNDHLYSIYFSKDISLSE